jgi:flagellar biosynthetic protein FliQ
MLLPDSTLDLTITDLARDLLLTVLVLAGPVLLAGLVVGVAVSLFQALTSVQEQTLSLVPKMFCVMLVALLLLAPALHLLVDYTRRVFERLVSFGLA